MKKVCIIGHFAFGKEYFDGQTVKTKIITSELEKRLGADAVLKIDTHGGVKKLPRLLLSTIFAMKKCKNTIILPAHNGLRIFAPLTAFFKGLFHTRLHYIVIGGWLPEYLNNHKQVKKALQRFDGIYVETNTMKKALEKTGFSNIYILKNCKNLDVLDEKRLNKNYGKPIRLCTFSRVVKEKGIEDAVNAVKEINVKLKETQFTLDIYGTVDEQYKDRFENLKNTFPDYTRYRGEVAFDKTTQILKNYDILLFPTHYFTEGIPGTIIDAYSAGLPVISSRWQSFGDVIEDKKTGIGYEFGSYDALLNTLYGVKDNMQQVIDMKSACIKKAYEYTTKYVVNTFVEDSGISVN